MEENNPQQQQQLFPCPYCKRKFIAKSLEIHLKSHNKNNKNSYKPTYNNQAFIDAVDRAMAEEEKHLTSKKNEEGIFHQPSEKKKQKKKVENNNVNQAFLDKLESELKKEEEGIAYQPSKKKKNNNGEGMTSNDAHKAFLERLEQEMQKEKEKSKYVPSKKKEIDDKEDMKKIFSEKVEKEIENDMNQISEKKQIKELKKKEEKEKKLTTKEKPAENGELICYLCYKLIPINNYLNHLKECETNFRRNNLSKDLEAMRPKKLNEIKNKLSTL